MSRAPSFGLQIGHSLAKCAMIKRGRAIRLKDDDMKTEALDFYQLFEMEWTDKVSSHALQTLKERRYYKEEEVPETSDLIRINRVANERVQEGTKLLHENSNEENWQSLSRAVYVAATVFNHRRGAEVAEMPTSTIFILTICICS